MPAIAKAIDESNKKGKNMHLNLKGLVLGNPSIHAAYKFMYMPQYAFMNGLLSQVSATYCGPCAHKNPGERRPHCFNQEEEGQGFVCLFIMVL